MTDSHHGQSRVPDFHGLQGKVRGTSVHGYDMREGTANVVLLVALLCHVYNADSLRLRHRCVYLHCSRQAAHRVQEVNFDLKRNAALV